MGEAAAGFDVGGADAGVVRPARRGDGRRWRAGLTAVAGELLLTLGLLVGLYLVYLLWWTNVTADQQTRRGSAALLQQWHDGLSTGPPVDGQGFAFLYVPALGSDYRALVMQGTDPKKVLNTGAVGHYADAALPWDASGNFAVAGHRDGHGMIFRDLDRLRPGERVYVQSAYGWFVYRLDREAAAVPVTDVGVVAPIPVGSGYTEPGRYLTLTTCTPIYVDSRRLVWWGTLVGQSPSGQVPAGVTVAG